MPQAVSKTSLKERVDQFNTLSLPGQPRGMHMGTSDLVNDLWRANQELLAALEAIHNAVVNEMMNDYRSEGCSDPKCLICIKSRAAEKAAKDAIKAAGA
jgi:hypothetical protein